MRWLQDSAHFLLIDETSQKSWQLIEAQALVWDLLCQHHSAEHVQAMLKSVYPDDDFYDMIANWFRDGVLVEANNGESGN